MNIVVATLLVAALVAVLAGVVVAWVERGRPQIEDM